jgi:predicted phage-related endonuclease
MLTEQDKQWRRLGIGGSDARTIAFGSGDQWKALRDEKVDGVEPVFSPSQRLLMDMGNAIEPLCIEQVSRQLGVALDVNVQREYAPDPFFRCTLDAITRELLVPIQCKFHTGDKSIEDLVEFYWPQLQHEMFVCGSDKLHFAVIFGHYGRFEMELVERDQLFLDSYILRAFEFKEYCETGVLPPNLETSKPKANIPRAREHVWPTNDNEIATLAIDWIENKEKAAKFDAAVKKLKELVPDDARSAKWVRNGAGIIITVNKAGAKSIKAHVEAA